MSENDVQLARARRVLDVLIRRPRKAYELVELTALTFDEMHEALEWLRAFGYVERMDIMGELHPDWVALRSLE